MLIAKLTISYDRGLARNAAQDLGDGIRTRGQTTEDGKVIRGLGTHFRSKEDADLVALRDREASRIRQAFRERFVVTPIDGVYHVSEKGQAQAFLQTMDIQHGIKVQVSEFTLTSEGEMNNQELLEWAKRIKRQLQAVQLGRKKEIDAEGLAALETLASCPVLSKKTGTAIRDMVGLVRAEKIDRVELRRRIETLPVEIEQASLSPKRSPVLA